MSEQWVKMIQNFIIWLPDMDILLNEDDECRLVIPWAAKKELLTEEATRRESLVKREYKNMYPAAKWLGNQ